MLALIDGDIIAYRVAWTVEDQDSFGIPRWRANEMLEGILADTGATEFTVFLSGPESDNFRYKIYPEYKESRKNKPKPKWLERLKEYLIVDWGARIACGEEADDALGINQRPEGTVICSIDKDLKQIPGYHYNFVKKEKDYVTKLGGLKSFYRQILTGDSGDDVPGLDRIGPAKSLKLISPCTSEASLVQQVYRAYIRAYKDSNEALRRLNLSGSLLKIKQKEDEEIWQLPVSLLFTPTEESPSQSTQLVVEENVPSTEPINTEQHGTQ